MADKLTPQQMQAVMDRGGNLLVSAAAGSGKTKVLVDRLLRYLTDENDPANLDEFLIITYTKAAASELRSKIAEKLTQRIALEPENKHLQKQIQRLYLTKISTVHGFCSDIIREYGYLLDVSPDFRVADENECIQMRQNVMEDLMESVYGESSEHPGFLAFVDSQGIGRTDALIPQIIERVYDSSKCHLAPEKWLDRCLNETQRTDLKDAGETLWGRYLIEELHEYLDVQIDAIRCCADQADQIPEFVKPAANIRDLLFQLEALRHADTWQDIWSKRIIDYGRLTFPRKNPYPELSERIKAVRKSCKAELDKRLLAFTDSTDRIMSDLGDTQMGNTGLIALVRAFDKEYSRMKHSRRVLDFSDLEHKTLDLLWGKSRSCPTAAAAEIGDRFREIMVDEYQDSNAVQDAIFSALTNRKHNCFMVGDVKQSIYQFRLADPGIFLSKYSDFSEASDALPGEDRKVLLSHNFRSGAEVIEAVNDVFSICMSPRVGGLVYGQDEALREGIPHVAIPDSAVEFITVDVQEETYPEEAAVVAERICEMLQSGAPVRGSDGLRPVCQEDIVILLRSPSSIGKYYQTALESRGIRCNSGNGTDLFHTEEISTLRAFLQIILNPRQDIPLLTVLASPLFGFTADDLAAVRGNKKKGYFYDALAESDHPKAREFLDAMVKLRQEARTHSVTGLLQLCFRYTNLDGIYGAMADGENRKLNLQQFYQLAVNYEAGYAKDLGQFMEYLESLEGRGLMAAGSSAAGVTIMSIHKSKGLEFPVVFLCGLGRKFNTESLRAQILCDKELGLGLYVTDTENRVRYPSVSRRAIAAKTASQSISEEIRILYVAMTRARDRLVMIYSAKNLTSTLTDIVLRMDTDAGRLICMDASCPGEWIMLTALGRIEAGQLHALSGRPASLRRADFPWKISISEASQKTLSNAVQETGGQKLPDDVFSVLQQALAFQYPHMEATSAPSKQTATGMKGRIKDEEAAEKTGHSPACVREWRKPAFSASNKTGIVYGNAIHAAMQRIRYEVCTSLPAVEKELSRLVAEGYLTEEQKNMIDANLIAAFFETDIGKRLRDGADHLREFKFSILCNGEGFGDGLTQEKVLLQGVVDCAILEEDGITIVDFKSDSVTQDSLKEVVDRYRNQLMTYADAIARIFEKPIKSCLLYFFRINTFCEV